MSPNEFLSAVTKEVCGSWEKLTSYQLVGGGCINSCYMLETSAGTYFLKCNDQSYEDMFLQEARGLRSLGDPGHIRVPRPLSYGVIGKKSYLLMEYIKPGPPSGVYWEKLAVGLAAIHRISNENFGWQEANYIGRLLQANNWSKDWEDFFINQRLEPQVKMAVDRGLMPENTRRKFSALYTSLEQFMVKEPPALVHGDLWSGNIMCDHSGLPCLVDPAIYFAHREIELAFTTLFGGFDTKFYQAYQETFPMAEGYMERFHIYNLYPLLVHLNLFGSAYLSGIRDTLNRFD